MVRKRKYVTQLTLGLDSHHLLMQIYWIRVRYFLWYYLSTGKTYRSHPSH